MKNLFDFNRISGVWWLAPLVGFILLLQGAIASIELSEVLGFSTTSAVLCLGLGVLSLLATLVLVWAFVRFVNNSEEARQEAEMAHVSLHEAMEALPIGLAVYDPQDRLVLINREASEMSPYRGGGDLLGQSYESLIRRSLERGEIQDALGREEEWLKQRMEGRGKLSTPLLRRSIDGRWMHFYEIGTPSGYLVMMRLNVTELVQKAQALENSNARLEHLSTTDALTRLANRRAFDQCLKSEWQRSTRNQQPLSLLMIDIDYFKLYNDHYGHVAGDDCLRQIAAILFDCAQRSGELVARYGGEEFAMLLPGADAEAAVIVAQRCLDELTGARIAHAKSQVSPWLTCSIGLATVVASKDLTPETLVKCADEALYHVKSAGRAHFYVAACPPA
jgi:diguanylate cyclase (GGDEF)-like protein